MYYLAGPMTGLPNFNYPAFEDATKLLRHAGYNVRSPHERFRDEIISGEIERPWWEYASNALRLLLYCSDIILLPNWYDSKGALLEKRVARELGMGIYEYESEDGQFFLQERLHGRRDVHDD